MSNRTRKQNQRAIHHFSTVPLIEKGDRVTATILVGPEVTTQNTDNNVRGVDFAVYELEPSAVPLTVLMETMGSQPATNPKFEWSLS